MRSCPCGHHRRWWRSVGLLGESAFSGNLSNTERLRTAKVLVSVLLASPVEFYLLWCVAKGAGEGPRPAGNCRMSVCWCQHFSGQPPWIGSGHFTEVTLE